jgi:hypothetical protein
MTRRREARLQAEKTGGPKNVDQGDSDQSQTARKVNLLPL